MPPDVPAGIREWIEEADASALSALMGLVAERWLGDPPVRGDHVKQETLRFEDLARMLRERWTAEERKSLASLKAPLVHLERFFGGMAASDITPDLVTRYALARRKAGAAVASINLSIALLHRAFVIAKEADRIRDIPRIRKMRGERRRTGTISPDVWEAILAHVSEHVRPILRFLHATGWRLGEALGLTWDRVDLAAGEVRLEGVDTKTGQPRVRYFKPDSELAALLQQQRGSGFAVSRFVFPNVRATRHGDAHFDRCGVEHAWRRAIKRAGVPGHPIIHDLRRTFVVDCQRASVPLFASMALVGHQNISVHQGYATVSRQAQDDAIARLEVLRAGHAGERKVMPFAK